MDYSNSGPAAKRSTTSSRKVTPKKITQARTVMPTENSVDNAVLEQYLRSKISNRQPIIIRYQSQRKNSAKKWRSLSVISYDSTYITVQGYDNVPYKYRRDRVVEIS